MTDYSKHVKRLLRELAAEAYEKELSRELAKLEKSFDDWREGRINSGELSDRIHQYEGVPHGNCTKNTMTVKTTSMLPSPSLPGCLIEKKSPNN